MNLPLDKIPVFRIPDRPIVSSTQDEFPVAEIIEDVILFKNGGAALVLESTSLNFGLLSEKEQQAVIYAYAALLNSLSFSIQIVIRSQRKDITSYLGYLDKAFTKIGSPKLQVLAQSYRQFLTETIKKKNVLGKRFFIVIPFSPLELGVGKSFVTATKRAGPLPFPKSYVLKKAEVTLYPRRDHLIRQVGRLGIKLRPLLQAELIELFHDIYTPKLPPLPKKEEIKQ